jgi:glutathione S-transferase
MMQLLVSDTSPYARKCRILIRELGLIDRVEECDAHPFENGELLLNANPLGRVPCLIMDDGRALTESALIAQWLNECTAQSWPQDWDDRRLEALGAGLLDLAVGRRIEMVRDTKIYSAYWINRRQDGILRALDQLEVELTDVEFKLSLGQLSIAVGLDYLDFRYPEASWRTDRPALVALFDFWAGRSSFKETSAPADA